MKIRDLLEDYNIPYDTNPTIGFWGDADFVVGYHGTHERNVPAMLEQGINRPDPKTGMISITLDPNTAHGYAAMSGTGGEARFRAANGRAANTPHEERAIFKLKIPMAWIKQHMDPNLRGNLGIVKDRMANKDLYTQWRKENPTHPDHTYYQLSEIRVDAAIPPQFIVGVMKRPMKKKA